ncbi:DUF5131 family protein [bacterium]|nr:DUF5131 family protein [bacterium]
MAENSGIEWTDHTFNPWRGCSKVSAGTRIVASEAQWKKPLQWNEQAKKAGTRARVFCASLADVFEDWNGPIRNAKGESLATFGGGYRPALTGDDFCLLTMNDVRRRLFSLIDETPWLDWILVTKRPENIRKFWTARDCDTCGGFGVVQTWCGNVATSLQQTADDCPECSVIDMEFRPNVWLLTSVENQEQADKRIPELLKCRDLSPVLGLSCEPLLGPVDLFGKFEHEWLLDWIIAGGESGPNARPMHPDWARSLRDQCQAAGVPYFFKQWGEWLPVGSGSYGSPNDPTSDVSRNGTTRVSMLRDGRYCLEDCGPNKPLTLIDSDALKVFDNWCNVEVQNEAEEYEWERRNPGYQWMSKVGKKQAGRLLDGREWSEFPEINTSVAGR